MSSDQGPDKKPEDKDKDSVRSRVSTSATVFPLGRQTIFRSLSQSNMQNTELVLRSPSPQLTQEERETILNNEKLIRRLEMISYRFDSGGDISDLASEISDATSGADFSEDVSGFLKRMQEDSYESSSERITSYTREGTATPDDGQLLVLDPDHPLMQRFQSTYKKHLEKEKEKLTIEENAAREEIKHLVKQYEDQGEELYNLQQALSESQTQLENCHKDWHSFINERKSIQEQLLASRDQHDSYRNSVQEQEKKIMDLRRELGRWDILMNLMRQLQEEMRGDVGALRRAAEKVEGNLADLKNEKWQQDIIIKKKMEEAIRMEETLEMYKKHRTSQQDELYKARLNLSESQMRIECIEVEKRHVFQQWKQTLSQLEQKDEAIKTLYDSLTGLLNESFTRSTDISNLKKEIDKEMELNETLSAAKNRTAKLIFTTEAQIQTFTEKSEGMNSKLGLQTRILQESEKEFNDQTKELEDLKRWDDTYRKQLDAIVSERCDLEDQLAEKYLDYVSSEKSIIHSQKQAAKLGKTLKNTEGNVVRLENDLSHLIMQLTSTNIRCQKLKEDLNEHNKEVEEHTDLVKGLETLISKNNLTISNKQTYMNQLIAKLEQLVHDAGGDVSPLETKIYNLERNIESKANEMQALKVKWLQVQTELVFLSHEKDHLTATCIQQGRQFNILKDKKRRLEEKIADYNDGIHKQMISFKTLQNSIGKLAESVYKEKDNVTNLAKDNILTETTMIRTLKDAEMESIQFQAKLDALKEEKKQIESQLEDARQQILMWEKKTQLAKESKALVASDEIAGEMQEMRWDIHRMQNRFLQLKRQQETLVLETEKLISRRETIMSKHETQIKIGKKATSKSSIQKAIDELKNKLKQTVKQRTSIEHEIAQLQKDKDELTDKKEEEDETLENIKATHEGLEKSVRQTERHYQKNFHQLISLQQRTKFLVSLREKKYQMLSKDKTKEDCTYSWSVANALQSILKKLCEYFPHYEDDLLDLLARHEGRLSAVESN